MQPLLFEMSSTIFDRFDRPCHTVSQSNVRLGLGSGCVRLAYLSIVSGYNITRCGYWERPVVDINN